jgi:hypothetical protein
VQNMHDLATHLTFGTVNILMFIFQCGSVMYVRTIIGGIVCELNADGRSYLKAQADVECTMQGDDYVDARYAEIRGEAITGCVGFTIVLGIVVLSMLNPRMVLHKFVDKTQSVIRKIQHPKIDGAAIVKRLRSLADEIDTSEVLHFAGEKMDQKFYWWDVMILLRKIALVVGSCIQVCLYVLAVELTRFVTQVTGSLAVGGGAGAAVTTCWYIGSGIIIAALAVHAFARPFYDELADLCEFLSLISMLLLMQSGIVFKLLNDPSDPRHNPANFDFNKDGFIDENEYYTPIVVHSFDSPPPAFGEIALDGYDRESGQDPIPLEEFGPWWLTMHSDVSRALARISVTCIVLTIVIGV